MPVDLYPAWVGVLEVPEDVLPAVGVEALPPLDVGLCTRT